MLYKSCTKRFVVISVGGATRFANFGENFPKRKNSAEELCQILRKVTICIVMICIAAYARDSMLPVLHCLRGDAVVSGYYYFYYYYYYQHYWATL